jgi:hypothetical protein
MRQQRAFARALALATLARCDSTGVGTIAGVGNTTNGTGTAALTVLPTDVQMSVNSTVLLSTNAGVSSTLQWLSSNNNVATVAQTGEVTARSVGTAVITVRFAADTSNFATSNISVTQ